MFPAKFANKMIRLKPVLPILSKNSIFPKYLNANIHSKPSNSDKKFETVYSFPFIKYFALVNRLKVFHFVGSAAALPITGLLEVVNIIPQNVFLSTAYFSLGAGAVLSAATLPFRNIIGFIYISENDDYIKISYLDYWGRRKNRIVSTDDWIPLMQMPPRILDAIFLSPQLTDGTRFKLFIKHGVIKNPQKIGQVLE